MRGKHDACRVPHPSGLHVPSHGSPSVAAAPAMQRAHADICISQRKCACQCLLKSPKEGLSGRKLPCEQGRMSKGRQAGQPGLPAQRLVNVPGEVGGGQHHHARRLPPAHT